MPSVPIHLPSPTRSRASGPLATLPQLLHTPLGYALLEVQGTINFPAPADASDGQSTHVGRLVFPDYDPAAEVGPGPWMQRAWLFVGFQRMTGAVQKLPKPLAILRRQKGPQDTVQGSEATEALEIVEIVRWKVVFRSRPEPVAGSMEGVEGPA